MDFTCGHEACSCACNLNHRRGGDTTIKLCGDSRSPSNWALYFYLLEHQTPHLTSPHTPFPLPSASPPPPPHHHRYVTWKRVHVASPDQDGQTVDAMGGVACTPCDSDHRPDLEDEEDEQPTSAAPCRLPWLASSRRDPPLRVLRLLASPREIHGQA